jgi:hypothetical protein
MNNEQPERSLAEAVKELLTEDDLSDLTLQGNDGSQRSLMVWAILPSPVSRSIQSIIHVFSIYTRENFVGPASGSGFRVVDIICRVAPPNPSTTSDECDE